MVIVISIITNVLQFLSCLNNLPHISQTMDFINKETKLRGVPGKSQSEGSNTYNQTQDLFDYQITICTI